MTESTFGTVHKLPLATVQDLEFVEMCENVNQEDALLAKGIERETGHDVKAVEYFIKQRLEDALKANKVTEALRPWKEWVHFGCTSEDINNLAYGLMLKEAFKRVLRPKMLAVITALLSLADSHKTVAMLARTHGQPATPTTFGKEVAIFAHRLLCQLRQLDQTQFLGKFNGAVGNFNAHRAIYPQIDWRSMAEKFVTSLGLTYQPFSTQIECHDYISEFCHGLIRFHTILLDTVQDFWQYISRAYLKLRKRETEVGSSTMPHKVNPIDFENAEGNLGLANALLQFFATKLPISRMQRDLSDSTVLRNIGSAFGYSVLALDATSRGLTKVDVDADQLRLELDKHWEVLAEPLQTCLRSEGVPQGYEILKAATRGAGNFDKKTFDVVLTNVASQLPEEPRKKLETLTPHTYLGFASELVDQITADIDRYLAEQ